jgi:hypothetical protein
MLRRALAVLIVLATTAIAVAQDTPVPEHNRAELTEPPPRPGPGDVDERARRLLDAIVHDDPARATDFFLPREAFRAIKGIADPDALWDRIFLIYE